MTRFNCLPDDAELASACGLVLTCLRNNNPPDHPDGTDMQRCAAEAAEVWTIYGIHFEHYEFFAIHDERSAAEAVRVAMQIMRETKLRLAITVDGLGTLPAQEHPLSLAEWVTDWIVDDIPDTPVDEFRDDDFDNHPLAELREALVTYSDYGVLNTARNPYLPYDDDQVLALADALDAGQAADIWYDPYDTDDAHDAAAVEEIEAAQNAMHQAAQVLRAYVEANQ